MTRWNGKRWAWAIVTGSALAGAAAAADVLPKMGESITLKFQGQPDRIVTVVKATKKPDGSVETEVKDPKSGDTFTLVDPAPESKAFAKPAGTPAIPTPLPPLPKPIVQAPAKPAAIPALPTPLPPVPAVPPVSAKPSAPAPVNANPPVATFAVSPSSPPKVAAPTPMPPSEEPRDKRRLFNREASAVPKVPAAEASTPPPIEEKKPGILGRFFGKKPTPPAMPAASLPPAAAFNKAPVPAFNPTPAPAFNPMPRVSAEPPRVMPAKPIAPAAPGRVEPVLPPTPVIPAVPVPSSGPGSSAIPSPLPSAKPAPAPAAIPSIPTPTIPAIPTAPQSKLPVVPAVASKPTGTNETVRPASHTPIEMSLPEEVQPYAAALKTALPPSHRMIAAKGLAEGRHGSSDAVKGVLFHAALNDPCPAVKACCIEHLCTLGYYDPAFLKHLKVASTDPSEEVRVAAKLALVKMSPR